MSVKKTNETTSSKILNSDIYDITRFVDDIKKMAADEAPVILSGVTTRGIRMVTGERLLKEADEAVKHAAEDVRCPVVGFRADAIKYRKFIETK